MNAIIVSNKSLMYVQEALGHTDISYQKAGQFNSIEFLEFCESVAKINIRAFITDVNCTDPETFMRGIIQYQKLRRNTKIIVVALDRYEDDGIIHQLADMGIDVITTSPGTKPGSIVPALHNLLPDIENKGKTVEWDSPESEMERVKDKIYRYTSKLKLSGSYDGSDVTELELPDVPIQEKIVLKDRIIGTIIVAVMGVESKVGSTHQSILIANYLKRKGYSVGLVEANSSEDFTRIENAYEGTQGHKSSNSKFSIEGVEYYKNRKDDMSAFINAGHDYLVLDIGSFEESEWSKEFFRASVQIVIGAGSEWRQDKIKRFRDLQKKIDQSNWVYCIPFVENISVKDIRKDLLGNQVFRIPPHPDPYKSQGDTDSVLYKILKGYMGDSKKISTKALLYGVIAACIIIIAILVVLLINKL